MNNIYQFSFYTAQHYCIKNIPTLLFYLSLQGKLLKQKEKTVIVLQTMTFLSVLKQESPFRKRPSEKLLWEKNRGALDGEEIERREWMWQASN